MNEFVYSYPTKVYFGKKTAVDGLAKELSGVGQTVMLAYEEQAEAARPTLRQAADVEGYDTIFLGFPNWWGRSADAVVHLPGGDGSQRQDDHPVRHAWRQRLLRDRGYDRISATAGQRFRSGAVDLA